MAGFASRYGKSLAIAVGLHLVAAGCVGLVSFAINKTPPNIMEVTLAGGSGGGAEAAVQTKAEAITAPIAREDIVDKKLKQQEKQQAKTVGNKTAGAVKTGTAVGSGQGEGSGLGNSSGSGSGSGEGSGSGTGSGTGMEKPTVPPRLLSKTNPRYPLGARSKNITGTANVRMLVNEKGRVESAAVAGSSGNGELDASAVECVYKWKFSPAKNSMGKAVPCYITIHIRFTIS